MPCLRSSSRAAALRALHRGLPRLGLAGAPRRRHRPDAQQHQPDRDAPERQDHRQRHQRQDHQHRADHAEDAEEARQQPDAHGVERDQEQAGDDSQRADLTQQRSGDQQRAAADVARVVDRPRAVEEVGDREHGAERAEHRGDREQDAADERDVDREADELRPAGARRGGQEGHEPGERQQPERVDHAGADQRERVVLVVLVGRDLDAGLAPDRAALDGLGERLEEAGRRRVAQRERPPQRPRKGEQAGEDRGHAGARALARLPGELLLSSVVGDRGHGLDPSAPRREDR